MESAATTKPHSPTDSGAESSEPKAIAIQDRLVLVMFLIVGLTFGVMILVDLFVGCFR